MRVFFAVLMMAIVTMSCSTTRIVKPLAKKEVAVGFDFGGPIIDFAGAKIPIPFTSLSGAYGIDSAMTVWGGLHTTSLAFENLQVDAGIIRDIIPARGRIPGFSIAPVANMIVNLKQGDFRIYPELDLNVHWQYSLKRQHYMYFSLSNWFDPWAKRAHGEPNKGFYAPNLALGHTFVTNKMRYTLELRWLAPNASNRNLVVSYNGIGGQGSMAFYFGIYRKF